MRWGRVLQSFLLFYVQILKQLGVSVACAVQDAADPLLRQLMREWTSTSSRLKILGN